MFWLLLICFTFDIIVVNANDGWCYNVVGLNGPLFHKVCCPGYGQRGDFCVPLCKNKCVNGICVEPNTCDCIYGYQKSSSDPYKCEPKCSRFCINGKCTGPEKCTCNKGYSMTKNQYLCLPQCSKTCKNGICITPEKCTCVKGYVLKGNNTFECISEYGIDNYYKLPKKITCTKGYFLDDNNHCVPKCHGSCIRGTCTSPDVCSCKNGYFKNPDKPNECIPLGPLFCSLILQIIIVALGIILKLIINI